MNERIKELAEQVRVQDRGYFIYQYNGHHSVEKAIDLEKFAELIVQECAGIAYEYDIPNLSGPGEFIGNRIKKHFGVRE